MRKEVSELGSVDLLSPGYEQGNSQSLKWGMCPIQHSAWDSATKSWFLQGNLCQMNSSIPAQTHHIWNKVGKKWVPSKMKPHPVLKVRTAVSKSDYALRGFPAPKSHQVVVLEALADTGAMMVVLGEQEVRSLGVGMNELLPTTVSIQVAICMVVKPLGMVILVISCKDEAGIWRTMRQQAYVMAGAHQLFLSHEALEELGCIRGELFLNPMAEVCEISEPEIEGEDKCTCPTRSLPPANPEKIPFPPTEENVGKLKEWIQDHFKASAFNNCSHQKLPLVKGSPPLELHLDESVKPVVCHKVGSIPLHFEDQVKQGLDRDVWIGVLRKIPVNTPVDSFLSHMYIATKKDGKPRRTVDFKALKRACPRQTHSVEPPFKQACGVPGDTWKTCLDAKDGYHSITIAEWDRKHTAFITPWGHYEYLVTPQGPI